MAEVSISEAARLTGKGRATIQRHIKIGRLSAGKDKAGNPFIDTSELARVYGYASMSQDDTPKEQPKIQAETLLIQALQEQLRAAHEREDWLKRQFEAVRCQIEAEQERIRELERRMLPQGEPRRGIFSRFFGR